MTLDLDRIRAAVATANPAELRQWVEALGNEVEKLQTELTTARQTIVNLLGENRALRAELRGREPTPPSYDRKLDGEEI